MITKLTMKEVASFKNETKLETDKKVNIIYGLNGTGKTTISDFLYNKMNPKFSKCSVAVPADELLLVYNTTFIQDNFYEKPNLNGIFTLSKENKIAEENIKKANEKIARLEEERKNLSTILDSLSTQKNSNKKQTEDKTWQIKDNFAGGDRVLEYCLEGLMGKKEKLFEYLHKINKPESQPQETIDELKKEVTLLNDSTAGKYELLPTITFDFNKIEEDEIFAKVIVGNENSIISELIKKLNNADWVKNGLKYIPDSDWVNEKPVKCPFCQQETITREIYNNIINYFDEEYEREINTIRNLLSEYINSSAAIRKESYDNNPFIKEVYDNFDKLYSSLINCLSKNARKMEDKINSPSQKCSFDDSGVIITKFNNLIENVNIKIKEHNNKIDHKQQTLNNIKSTFWKIMRYNYDAVIVDFSNHEINIQKELDENNAGLQKIEKEINDQRKIIETEQRKTVNIDESIDNINRNLSELGIDSFKISKHSENFYKLIRENSDDEMFKTLSEGEKTIISFLYFFELCRGKKTITETTNKKIIIIDDPISSLSHIYVFNIGEMIKREFCNSSQYEQVFILTHSLYFFYEMTEINHDKREEKQKLFRIIKNSGGSMISEMKYEEIQNDYQSYWYVINDSNNPHALIANCMRNIVEYFFNFIEKRDLNNVFQKGILKDIKFQSFYRFINRESHSLGQNIFDYKEFDYGLFKEGLKQLFYECGYEEHYKKMAKLV